MKTKELTVAEIREIAARAEKATPGPWEYGVRADKSMWLSIGDPTVGPHYQSDLFVSPVDAGFIAHARLDVPALCETALAAIAERDALKEDVKTEIRNSAWEAARATKAEENAAAFTTERDRFRNRADEAEASATDLLNTWAREHSIVEAKNESEIKRVINRLWDAAADMRQERDRLRAAAVFADRDMCRCDSDFPDWICKHCWKSAVKQ